MYTERDHIRRLPISPHPYKFLAGTNERLLLYQLSYFLMVRKVGLEPTTHGLETKEVLMQEVECQIGFEPTKCNFADCTPNHLATGTGADIRT